MAALSTSRSTIIHASLAYLSPELQTYDSILRFLPRATAPCTALASLPPELLLVIRTHLLPLLTAHLIARSAAALVQYEASLRALLCPECLAYNDDVFGTNVWDWEHFSGGCACAEIRANAQTLGRILALTVSRPTPPSPQPAPRLFASPQQWLQAHLSSEARKLSRGPSLLHLPPPTDVWDVVSEVLREFGCEIQWGAAVPPSAQPAAAARWAYRTPSIAVVPILQSQDAWQRHVTLQRVDRELGLSLEYEEFGKRPSVRVPALPLPAARACKDALDLNASKPAPDQVRRADLGPVCAAALFVMLLLFLVALALCFVRIL